MKNHSSHHITEEISVINYFSDSGYIWAVKKHSEKGPGLNSPQLTFEYLNSEELLSLTHPLLLRKLKVRYPQVIKTHIN